MQDPEQDFNYLPRVSFCCQNICYSGFRITVGRFFILWQCNEIPLCEELQRGLSVQPDITLAFCAVQCHL